MALSLGAWWDHGDSFERVGTLEVAGELGVDSTFAYDRDYVAAGSAAAISASLPTSGGPFRGRAVRAWFSALMPEGHAAEKLAARLGVEVGDYASMLAGLRDETVGALVFTVGDDEPGRDEGYDPVGEDFFEQLAAKPRAVAPEAMGRSRLSLAGEMAKVGLYHDARGGGWFLTRGTAPTTHIVKAGGGPFPGQTVNEAICTMAAGACGLDAAEVELIRAGGGEPLLAVRRFDRPLGDVLREVCGMPRPGRLHQEDMCQAMGVPGEFKYQPSGADYLVGMAEALSAVSSNPFGEKVVLFDQTVFNVLVGNCDNHLKNYSVLYRERLGEGEASPMYDVACTTLYADVAREMGVALVPSRKVDDVRAEDLYAAARAMGIPRRIAELEVGELAEGVRSAVRGAGDRLEGQGFEEAGRMRDLILAEVEARLAQLFG